MGSYDILRRAGVKLLWFDSLGAKSSSVLIRTSDGYVIIDPGAAAMQPSYPLSAEDKVRLRGRALDRIEKYLIKCRAVVITHYHYDHHVLPGDPQLRRYVNPYSGKLLILKDPNQYINASQWGRARAFIASLAKDCGASLEELLTSPAKSDFPDPLEGLEEAASANWGEYSARKAKLLKRGRTWFEKLTREYWGSRKWVRESELPDGTKLVWGDGRVFNFGNTHLKILNPWFHGLEYDRTGWVTPVVIEKPGAKVFYTSDVMGPEIEDYATAIIEEMPNAIILDGPPTYLFPYMLNRINLRRAIANIVRIIRECEPDLIIYDHHLLRECEWRERVREAFSVARRFDVRLVTAAEYLRRKPLIDTICGRKGG